MTPSVVLAWCLTLAPRHSVAVLQPWAHAIAEATDDAREARQLVVVAFHETGFRRSCRRCVPFGATALRGARSMPLVDVARWTLGVLRRGRSWCGPRVGPYAHHITGACRCTPEAEFRALNERRLQVSQRAGMPGINAAPATLGR